MCVCVSKRGGRERERMVILEGERNNVLEREWSLEREREKYYKR